MTETWAGQDSSQTAEEALEGLPAQAAGVWRPLCGEVEHLTFVVGDHIGLRPMAVGRCSRRHGRETKLG